MTSDSALSTSGDGHGTCVSHPGADTLCFVQHSGLWLDAWRRLRKNRLAVAGAVIVAVVVLFALLGAIDAAGYAKIFRFRFDEIDLGASNQPPNATHWFGTDGLGRDLFIRTMVGGSISLLVAVVATSVSLLIGVAYGSIAGYVGGKIDEAMMRVVDILYSLPYIFVVIVVLAFFSKSLVMLFAALGAVSWLTMARIVRGQVLSIKNQEYVLAARALGLSPPHILLRHVIPNTLSTVIVYTTLTIPSVMLSEAFLSFLGLGVQPPLSSWGTLVNDGIAAISVFPWQMVFPGVVMGVTLMSLNFLGDGLRDALDPRSSGQ